MEQLSVRQARRLALARSGLLGRRWSDLPERASGGGKRGREAALAVVRRFGYLQLDSVAVAGARSHGIVLISRLAGLSAELPERLLAPGEPLFEYWGHEASWIPIELYPAFAFRRREFRTDPWWGPLLDEHPRIASGLLERIERDGPLRSVDLDEPGSGGWWQHSVTKKVLRALWSAGEIAIRERRRFQRSYDLAERVIPERWRGRDLPLDEALPALLLRALGGHGWARTSTLTQTWRLKNKSVQVRAALARLVEAGEVVPCAVKAPGRRLEGWIRTADLPLAAALDRARPRRDRGVLLSPFDPVLWDRARVAALFGFEQVLEIFKPAAERRYGYYCLPVLAGERLVARMDLKADQRAGRLAVLALHYEDSEPSSAVREAVTGALERYAVALSLVPRRA